MVGIGIKSNRTKMSSNSPAQEGSLSYSPGNQKHSSIDPDEKVLVRVNAAHTYTQLDLGLDFGPSTWQNCIVHCSLMYRTVLYKCGLLRDCKLVTSFSVMLSFCSCHINRRNSEIQEDSNEIKQYTRKCKNIYSRFWKTNTCCCPKQLHWFFFQLELVRFQMILNIILNYFGDSY